MTTWLVFLLEEPSAWDMLQGLLPKLGLPDRIQVQPLIFEGKRELENNAVHKIRHWRRPGKAAFIILRDQDKEDCSGVLARLQGLAVEAGRPDTIVRVACHELESFYLGDLRAVEKGLALGGMARLQGKRQYRNPDALGNPYDILLGLTRGKYQKRTGSRAIGQHLALEGNTSASFNKLLKGILRAASCL